MKLLDYIINNEEEIKADFNKIVGGSGTLLLHPDWKNKYCTHNCPLEKRGKYTLTTKKHSKECIISLME